MKTERKILLACILIAVFFLLHTFSTYRDVIGIVDILLFFSGYLLVIGLLYGLLLLIKIEKSKVLAIIFLLLIPFFFFAPFHEWIIDITNAGFLSRYFFLIPCLIVFFFIVIRKSLKQKKRSSRLFNYVNLTLGILSVAEILNFAIGDRFTSTPKDILKISSHAVIKRNIYFLIFDEYPSSISLKNRFKYTNRLDSLLEQKGFVTFPGSISNYNFTPFSIASTLNMSYLDGFNPDSVTYSDYTEVQHKIYNNRVTSFLNSMGYDIINLSIFDLKNSSEGLKTDFFSSGVSLIWELTFFGHLVKDVGWVLYSSKTPFRSLFINKIYQTKSSNQLILQRINALRNDRPATPFFLYAHFVMPHPPYFFDSLNNERLVSQVVKEKIENTDNSSTFLSYLTYTNSIVDKITSEILEAEKKEAIIIVLGDHGYRTNAKNREFFQNFNAIFLPKGVEKKLPFDSISNVNEFRLVFNLVFDAKLPLLKDSVFLLSDYNHIK